LLQDRALSIENAKYIFKNMRHIGDEIEFKKDGMIQKRAQGVLKEAADMLKDIEKIGIMSTIEQGKFADVTRKMDGGKGLDGVTQKGGNYFNPFIPMMLGGDK